ncbi:hypothetical protein F53441_13068 [Fusarium austroafricanum]|uniref:Ubiquitin-like domain-containing protein n=1 Tax=Fusarium austroafricanum TaxID=2364996 RepID=A0A8H4JSX0_9HYPO|nr:hypothetical protein F53441_13068 [Fusarium austroafricanum]
MSFGCAVGDVIAVLGLFERIAIELRNYKDAPTHFQQLRAELDLVHSTLKHVLSLDPECEEELQTLEKIRAIVMHCSQPLQAMVGKMRSKDGSLGHFKTTRSLSAIGTRLHWSIIAKSDVDSLRQVVMSQMSAINILLSVQQLTRVKRLALQSKSVGTHQSLAIEEHANAIAGHASNILSITSRTQSAVDALAADANIRAEIHSKQSKSIDKHLTGIETSMLHLTRQAEKVSAIARHHTAFLTRHAKALFRLMQDVKQLFIFLTKCSKEMLEAIGRNTRMLLDISGQLKRIIRAIEAIPLHLTLDIVRLDDAHGESWALPFQACKTWESFCNLLQFVVYANERPGANNTIRNRFAVALAKTGRQVSENNWTSFIKSGSHIEQAMVVEGVRSSEACMDPKCTGTLQDQVLEVERRKSCSIAENWYLLDRAYIVSHKYKKAFDCLETAVTLEGRSPSFWMTVDAADAFGRCIELNPNLPHVRGRLEALQAYIKDSDLMMLRTQRIHTMIETPLQTQYDAVDQAQGEHITLNPIRETGQGDFDDEIDEETVEE